MAEASQRGCVLGLVGIPGITLTLSSSSSLIHTGLRAWARVRARDSVTTASAWAVGKPYAVAFQLLGAEHKATQRVKGAFGPKGPVREGLARSEELRWQELTTRWCSEAGEMQAQAQGGILPVPQQLPETQATLS